MSRFLISIVGLAIACQSQASSSSEDFRPRLGMSSLAPGCYHLAVSAEFPEEWRKFVDGLGTLRLDSSRVSETKPELRRLAPEVAPTRLEASSWAADSTSERLRLYFVDAYSAFGIDVLPIEGGYAGEAWFVAEGRESRNLPGRVRLSPKKCSH